MSRRLVRADEASEKQLGHTLIREYFTGDPPNLGLAMGLITGTFPPAGEAAWTLNESVDEMLYVIGGHARIVYEDGSVIALGADAAAHMPRGIKYRIEDAIELRVVIATEPAWTKGQNKWLKS